MPTGGVSPTKESIQEWIQAGAACLGIGSKLISKELVAKEDWKGLTEKVRKCLALIKTTRENDSLSTSHHNIS
jgi:2-dehydro-3-deoxyphosphogluconate aldolase/(4S)-4-hydroxy-2-oxoglutarate aldolase